MPVLVSHMMAMYTMVNADPFMAISLLPCFLAYLKTGELLGLRVSRFFVDGEGNVVICLEPSSRSEKTRSRSSLLDPHLVLGFCSSTLVSSR